MYEQRAMLVSSLLALASGACREPAEALRVDAALWSSQPDAALPFDAQLPPVFEAAAPPPTACGAGPAGDLDQDGFWAGPDDCDDCQASVNVGALELPGNRVDDDCNGAVDEPAPSCDGALAIDEGDAARVAGALGLCPRPNARAAGLVSARFTMPSGSDDSGAVALPCVSTSAGPNPQSHGVLTSFGARVVPREGRAMLALSTGAARSGSYEVTVDGTGSSPLAATMCRESPALPGFPKPATSCPGVLPDPSSNLYDPVALELELKVPTNAAAFAFDFNFFSSEFPQFLCAQFNDHFVALLQSRHGATPADHNVSFDAQGNVVSVNNALIEVCVPGSYAERVFACKLGTADLAGTGFEQTLEYQGEPAIQQGGATGWVETRAPVLPGETITLRLAMWDAGDSVRDSTTLIDNFRWIAAGGTERPVEAPVTVPILR